MDEPRVALGAGASRNLGSKARPPRQRILTCIDQIRQPSPAADIDVMESKEEADDHARVARRYAQSTRGIARLHLVAIR